VIAPALARRPLALLPPLVAALLVLAVLGPNLRGAAAALLVAAGAAVLGLRARPAALATPRQLEVIDRVPLGPRHALVLVEAAGRRYLVATGASVTALPLEEDG
jgi:hypothetical protein